MENKAPPLFTRAGPARPHRAVVWSFLDEDVGRGFRPSSLHYLPSSGVSRSREEEKGRRRGAPAGNRAAL